MSSCRFHCSGDLRDLHSFPTRRSSDLIIVNIPGYRLTAFKTGQDVEADMLAMDVVVGAAVKHDTPLLAVSMVAVQFQPAWRSEEHTSELQSRRDLVCRLLLEKKKQKTL